MLYIAVARDDRDRKFAGLLATALARKVSDIKMETSLLPGADHAKFQYGWIRDADTIIVVYSSSFPGCRDEGYLFRSLEDSLAMAQRILWVEYRTFVDDYALTGGIHHKYPLIVTATGSPRNEDEHVSAIAKMVLDWIKE